jgi:hypothetical protein
MNKMGSFFWQMVFCEWRINSTNFTFHIGQISLAQNVGEIEWQFFCQILTTLARGTKVGEIDKKWQNKNRIAIQKDGKGSEAYAQVEAKILKFSCTFCRGILVGGEISCV